MNTEITTVDETQIVNIEDQAMSPEMLVRQVKLIQDVMKSVMKEGEHYGVIPGCGDKPSLLQPGAQKLGSTFRFAPYYHVTNTEMPNGHREYEIITTLEHIPTGKKVGQGVGSCSTMESKYRYRSAERVCPECGATAIIKGKKEFGGGWLCWKKKDGCGEKFKDGDTSIESQETGKVEYDNPADYYNTVLKMAKKRSHVDSILTSTAASDIFTQDIEDLPTVTPAAVVETKQPQAQKTLEDQFNELAGKASSIRDWDKIGEFLNKYKAPKGLLDKYKESYDLWVETHAPQPEDDLPF